MTRKGKVNSTFKSDIWLFRQLLIMKTKRIKMKTFIKISLVALVMVAICGCSKDSSKGDDSPKSGNIKFEDAVAKAKLVKLFDLNSDGELSYSEAAAVTSIYDLYWGNIKTLDELKYFTGITKFYTNYITDDTERFSIPQNVTSCSISKTAYLKKITCYSKQLTTSAVGEMAGGDAEFLNSLVVYVPKDVLSKYVEELKKFQKGMNPNISDEELNKIVSRLKGF